MNLTLHINGKPVTLSDVARKSGEVSFTLGGKAYHFRGQCLPGGSHVLEREVGKDVWQRLSGAAWQGRNARHVQLGALEARISEPAAAGAQAEQAELSPRAPMPGVVRKILVKAGDRLKPGQAIAIMEAMKLQVTLSAGAAAKVDAVLVREGEMIIEGAELVRLTAIKDAA